MRNRNENIVIGRKNKKQIQTHTIQIEWDGCVKYHGLAHDLPILDEQVISGSIKFFNDPEPCMIHRSAVISRYYILIEEWLDEINIDNDGIVMLSSMPEEIRHLLDIKEILNGQGN